MRIIFMGTPEFAIPSLKKLIADKHDIVAVVTAPDKPSGRGLKMQPSPVKQAAIELGIPVLQPVKLKDPEFIEELKSLNADIQVVVAFRMLPESVWNMPPLGTWNLHASLLPDYRGAAPIHHAVMQGEPFTGLTTFKLTHEIDTGPIALQVHIPIEESDTTGDIYEKMLEPGAELIALTLRRLQEGSLELIPQDQSLHKGNYKEAPKLFPETCEINWSLTSLEIHNKIRGLSPYPGAWTYVNMFGKQESCKIYKSMPVGEFLPGLRMPGEVITEGRKRLFVTTSDGLLEILELQPAGKRRFSASDFLNGLQNGAEIDFKKAN